MEYRELLWQPGKIGPMETKNRTVRSATNDHLSDRDGGLTQAWMDAYVELARGGVGVIITGQISVDASQRGDAGQPILTEDMPEEMLGQFCSVLSRTCQQVHACGARLVVQLSHTGPKADETVNARPAKAPADFTIDEIEELVKDFSFAAKICRICGVDGLQVHMAHGYLLSAFLSPTVNTRTDDYGGSLEHRFRLPGAIMREVKAVCRNELALLAKVDSNCCGDLPALLKLCKEAGADCVEVSGLDFAARNREEGPFYLEDAVKAREGIDMPLCLVGGIYTVEQMEQVMAAGIEFVSLSRALICEPNLINKMRGGEVTASSCLRCSGCFKVFRQRPVRCVLHEEPIAQLEEVFGPYKK